MHTPILPRSFYRRDPVTVARALLGQRLVSQVGGRETGGIIVETEAYLGALDRAAHTYGGRRTPRNESMWVDGGHLYVYFVYGMHHCANIVAGLAGDPVAVLLRALEPDLGIDAMFARRGVGRRRDLCSGPAKLCQALAIDRRHDGIDLVTGGDVVVHQVRHRALAGARIGRGPRVGIAYAGDWRHKPLRFWMQGNRHVSQ